MPETLIETLRRHAAERRGRLEGQEELVGLPGRAGSGEELAAALAHLAAMRAAQLLTEDLLASREAKAAGEQE